MDPDGCIVEIAIYPGACRGLFEKSGALTPVYQSNHKTYL